MQSMNDRAQKIFGALKRYKYVLLIVLLGLILLLLPTGSDEAPAEDSPITTDDNVYITQLEERLSDILSAMEGAGEVRVALTLKTGSQISYQTDNSMTSDTEDGKQRLTEEQKTVILSVGSAYDEAAVCATEYPCFRGALVLCGGADDPIVRLNCINAVSALTGLSSDKITVLKMK